MFEKCWEEGVPAWLQTTTEGGEPVQRVGFEAGAVQEVLLPDGTWGRKYGFFFRPEGVKDSEDSSMVGSLPDGHEFNDTLF